MSKLLIQEEPLQVLPSLAYEIGLNEAIMLQQIHYWIKTNQKLNRNLYDGKYWTYNTHDGWQKQFPFWSLNTVRRTLTSLIKQDLLFTANYNKLKIDRTIWYSVNYTKLSQIEQMHLLKMGTPFTQNEQMDLPKMSTPLPETNQRITTENIKATSNEVFAHIVDYLNKKANKRFKHTIKKTQTLINARLKEGFTVEDFEKVINTKVEAWVEDPKMSAYLRPETLFSNKFEGYLNEALAYEPKEDIEVTGEMSEADKKLMAQLLNPAI